ncbi:MAG: hypothetical protein IPP88_06585 [Betaproteobacteria bacterium]|nr:hypothetical protein [Betaproteobacteria bacterium]
MTNISPGRCLKLFAGSAIALLLAACAGNPPPPDWQANTKQSTERAIAAYLVGNTRVEAAELSRARTEVARTGRADLLARVELTHCAAQVASLVFGPCEGFEPLRADAAAPERVYADYLRIKLGPADIALLPESHRAVAAGGPNDVANTAALSGIADPLSRLVAAGVLFKTGRADPSVIALAIDAASSQGWRRPLLAWLKVQLQRAEQAGAGDDVQRLRRRIELVQGSAG